MSRPTVLVTGVSQLSLADIWLPRLAADLSIDRVLGAHAVPPCRDLLRRMGRAEFVCVDLRNPSDSQGGLHRQGRPRGACCDDCTSA